MTYSIIMILLLLLILAALIRLILPSLLFEKSLFLNPDRRRVSSSRIRFNQYEFFTRADIASGNHSEGTTARSEAYLESLEPLKQLLPLPGFMLKPLLKLETGYVKTDNSDQITTDKIIIYLHGAGGLAEENTLLHRMLVQSGCTVIRFSYTINYEKNGLTQPKRVEEMEGFLHRLNTVVAPRLTAELDHVLAAVKEELQLNWENKTIILMAHSFGAGILLNYAIAHPELKVNQFVNLDGTLLQPAITKGLAVPQLHLSQSQQFDISWLEDGLPGSPSRELGKDYGLRIQTLLAASGSEYRWIQIAKATHFTFTDFPYVLRPYTFLRKLAGTREASDRIRAYVHAFVSGGTSAIDLQAGDKEARVPSL